MRHAVFTHEASSESFARILNRFAHDPQNDLPSDSDAVTLSISERGAALNGRRKHAMAPVRVVSQNPTRDSTEASEISYERALRMHKRDRTTEASEEPQQSGTGISTNGDAPASSRAQIETKALEALRAATVQQAKVVRNKPSRSISATAAGKNTALANKRSNALNRKNAMPEVVAPTSGIPSVKAATNQHKTRSSKQGKSKQERKRSSAAVSPGSLSASGVPAIQATTPQTGVAKTTRARQKQQLSTRSGAENLSHQANLPAQPLQLELASHAMALAQRQSIISIRLNAFESEQLRRRAAESGISVSAYMRSCVLEAEHLRAQVKQALAEIRSSADTLPAPSSITIRPLERNLPSHHWPRTLWRSVTVLLGPLFSSRHRS